MTRLELLKVLAEEIQREAARFAKQYPEEAAELYEPYRAAADRLVDGALGFID